MPLPETPQNLLHFDRIRELSAQLDSPADALKFLKTYFDMLPGRLERILLGIIDCDPAESHDAVLSLRAASSMTGAVSAEACCLELEPLVRGNQFRLALLCAGRLSTEVQALYDTAPAIMVEAHQDLNGMAA
jgi:hypothetical protein